MLTYNLDSYKFSENFSNIDSKTTYKRLAFIDFLEGGASLVKTKQAKLDEKLFIPKK